MDSGLCSLQFTQHVDDPLIVGSKQPYGVLEEQHERCVDDAVGQLVGVGLDKVKGDRIRLFQRLPQILDAMF